MSVEPSGEAVVTFAEGVRDDVAELTATSLTGEPEKTAEVEALKLRIAELLVECKANPFLGEPMGRGLHPELTDCRRVRFDIALHEGKPRFRLIYRNEPSDGVPAECHWLAVAPRAGLRAHRRAQQRSRSE